MMTNTEFHHAVGKIEQFLKGGRFPADRRGDVAGELDQIAAERRKLRADLDNGQIEPLESMRRDTELRHRENRLRSVSPAAGVP